MSKLNILATALVSAKARMASCGLTKDGDLAVCVATELEALGYKLVRIPKAATTVKP